MGQDHSSGKRGQEAEAYGNVFVKLDQDTYLSDDTVTGTIYVQLKRPYPGDKICIKVKGKEFTKWIDKEHKQRQREDGTIEHYTVDIPREADFVPVKHVVDLYDWRNGSVIPPGQFSFPISFKIPPGLPSTFFLRSGTTVAEISYYVEAYLKPEKELYPKIKHKRPITVRQALRGDITTKEVSINQEVSTCCCLGKGSVAMWTAFEKNAYAPGEEARIVTEVDNSKCELAITNVRFELVQYIKLTAQNNSKALHFGIIGENLGRVEPGQTFLKEQRKEASLHLPPAIEGSAKAYKGDNQVQEYNLSPQQAISPSANGNLIKSNFGLRVACGMDGCVCDTMPTTELPVTIYSIIQRKVADPLPPYGWNPTPMPASNISIVISINGVAPGTISAGPAQPQNNTLMTNNQMPTQQSSYPQQQGQGQYQQQSQTQYTQHSQQPLSNRQQEAQYQQNQYQQESQYRQQEQRPPAQYQQQSLSQTQSIQSIQSKPQYQQEPSQYQQQQQSPTRYHQEQVQYQQPLSNRQSESQYRQEPQSNRIQESQYRQQEQSPPRQQYLQEYRQQEQSPTRQQESSQYRQEPLRQSLQKQPQTYSQTQIQIQPKQQSHQDLQYRQQEQSPPRQQYQQQPISQTQSNQSIQSKPQYQQEYRQQEQPLPRQQYQQESSQYRQNQPPLRQSNSQYQYQDSQSRHQEQSSPPRQNYQQESPQRYQQESQYRQQEQSPTRQQYQQQQQNNYQSQGYSEQGYNSQSQYGRGGERY